LTFPTPPAADSGETYKTLDARCRACELMGGDEGPCISDEMLEAEQRINGHPCPRREWPDADGPILAKLVQLGAIHGMGWNSSPLFSELFRVRYGGAPVEHQERMLMRILAAYSDEQVRAFLFPRAGK
jgi:hypothetical protein